MHLARYSRTRVTFRILGISVWGLGIWSGGVRTRGSGHGVGVKLWGCHMAWRCLLCKSCKGSFVISRAYPKRSWLMWCSFRIWCCLRFMTTCLYLAYILGREHEIQDVLPDYDEFSECKNMGHISWTHTSICITSGIWVLYNDTSMICTMGINQTRPSQTLDYALLATRRAQICLNHCHFWPTFDRDSYRNGSL